jgi:itaconate CoA-transferase
MRRPDLATDDRFATNPDGVIHSDELTAIIEQSLSGLSAAQVSDDLGAAGIASARLRMPEELTRHPQLAARDRWRRVHTPGGDIEALLPPVDVADWRPPMRPVPALGKHAEAVAAEFGISRNMDQTV